MLRNYEKVEIRNKQKMFLNLDSRALVLNLTFALLLLFSMFLCIDNFVEEEIVSKWYVFVGGSLLCCAISLFIVKSFEITIDMIALLLFLFMGYMFVRTLMGGLVVSDLFLLSIFGFIALSLSFKILPCRLLCNIPVICVAVCVMQAIYGLFQYIGLISVSRGANICGSFDNPAGFAASLIAGFPFCFYLIEKVKWRYWVGLVSILIIVVAVLLSGSRAGIVSIVFISIIYFVDKRRQLLNWKYITPFIVVCVVFLSLLFFLKKDSALGRILIWKSTCNMIVDSPIVGHGSGAFMSDYMIYQSNYFDEHKDSSYSLLADNVTHPFNEYILLLVEYGVVGLLLLVVLLFVLIKGSKQISLPMLCLLSVGVFACFSYPIRYPFVVLLLAYSMASFEVKPAFVFRINFLTKLLAVGVLIIVSVLLIRDIKFEKRWGELVRQGVFNTNNELLNKYASMYEDWNGDPMFLYNYGAVLNSIQDYEQSNVVMNKCKEYFNDYNVQMILADNYLELGQSDNAEMCYITACNMIPNRFMPLYKLMLLYESKGCKQKAADMAITIINKKIKIPSDVINQIKGEAQELVDGLSRSKVLN